MGGEESNPYESPGAPSISTRKLFAPNVGWKGICTAYTNPLLMAMGVILYVFFYYAGPSLREAEFPRRFIVYPLILLLLIGALALMAGWAVASFQLVLAFVRLSQRDSIWKHHIAAALLAIAVYAAFFLVTSNGILLLV